MYDSIQLFSDPLIWLVPPWLWGGLCVGRTERGKVLPSGFRYEMAVALVIMALGRSGDPVGA